MPPVPAEGGGFRIGRGRPAFKVFPCLQRASMNRSLSRRRGPLRSCFRLSKLPLRFASIPAAPAFQEEPVRIPSLTCRQLSAFRNISQRTIFDRPALFSSPPSSGAEPVLREFNGHAEVEIHRALPARSMNTLPTTCLEPSRRGRPAAPSRLRTPEDEYLPPSSTCWRILS